MKCVLLLLATCACLVAQDIDLTGYRLAFEENFDTLSVSASSPKGSARWYWSPPYGASGNYSLSRWSIGPATMSVAGGILANTAWWDSTIAPLGKYRSGCLSSMDTRAIGFAQQYGYFSARMKMPNAGTGAWPAFWLKTVNSIPSNQGLRLEVDIIEWYGSNPSDAYHNVHAWGGTQSHSGASPLIPGGNPSGQYHIYGARVDPANITFFIDGIQTFQTATPATHIGPMYVMVTYALGGGWPLTGDPFPQHGSSSVLVDWVRVYSLPVAPPTNLRIVP